MKNTKKLKLNQHTVRLLSGDRLADVVAGKVTGTPTLRWCISDGGSCPPDCN